ncbi:MAG: 16S rRNA (guanine(966)-N(2))-methyltransferase RsmD [Coriobacteriia bacterium]|nr:16S rRNA (guanine(966)-N(2))-methyltransferase RsmD [Coriobacteriia bacterium]
MRIIGGKYKGIPIEAPKGQDTRPTYDRVRESLASIILAQKNNDLEGLFALDAFAGSGAVGFELLSRGAQAVFAFEKDRKAQQTIKKNAAKLSLTADEWKLFAGDILSAAKTDRLSSLIVKPLDIVFLDPPYAYHAHDLSELVDNLDAKGRLAQDCLVIYEREKHADSLELSHFQVKTSKTYGTTVLDVFLRTKEIHAEETLN